MRALRFLASAPFILGACTSSSSPARLQFDNPVNDFGVVEVDVPILRSAILRNVGDETTNVVLSTDSPDAPIISDTCGWLSPDESCSVTVSLTAVELGRLAHELRADTVDGEPAVATLVAHGAYRLTVDYDRAGGRITTTPDRIFCDRQCTGLFPDPNVTLQAHSDARTTFVAWSGSPACSTSDTCMVTLDGPLTVTATFEAISGP